MPSFKVKCDIAGKQIDVTVSGDKPTLKTLREQLLKDKLVQGDEFTLAIGTEVLAKGAEEEFELDDDMTVIVKAAVTAPAKEPPKAATEDPPKTEPVSTQQKPTAEDKPKDASKPELKSDPKGEVKPEPKPEAKTEPKPAAPKTTSAPKAGSSDGDDLPAYKPERPAAKTVDFNAKFGQNTQNLNKHLGIPVGANIKADGTVGYEQLIQALDGAIKTHLFPLAVVKGERDPLDYTVVPLSVSKITGAELFEEGQAQSLAGTLAGGGSKVEARAFTEQWEREAYAFGYSGVAAKASQEVAYEGAKVGSSHSGSIQKSNQTSDQTATHSMQYCVEYKVPRLRVTLDDDQIKLKDKFVADIRKIVEGDAGKAAAALKKYFLAKGFCIGMSYTLGARLVSSGESEYEGSAQDKLSQMAAVISMAVRLSAEQDGVGGSADRKATFSTGEEFRKTITSIQQTLGSEVRTLGGADQVGIDQAKWLSSLTEPGNWKLIFCDELKPIWHFLEPDLRSKVEAILDRSSLKADLQKEVDDYKKHSEAHRELVKQSKKVARIINQENFRSEKWGVEDYPGSEDAYTEDYRHTYKELFGFLGIPLPNTRERVMTVAPTSTSMKDRHVITWFKVTRHWGDDAHFEIRNPALMTSFLEIHFESAVAKGHHWELKVRSAHVDKVVMPTVVTAAERLFLQALQED